MKNKVINFSLWGSNPKYCIGAIRNAQIASDIYSDWICRFYVSNTVPKDISKELESLSNTDIIHRDVEGDWRSMFWRFEASYDENIYISIFRDADSRLSTREKYAVDEWISSDKTFHIMRDHPYHKYPILGGMWGYKNNNKYPMQILLESFNKTNKYGTDYEFFAQTLYPLIGPDKVVHDEFFEKIPFPTARNGTEFVGDVFDENDIRHPDYYKHIP
jgi:protein O-GlcNAc transferase